MNLLNMFFNKKYIYYIYLIISKYTYNRLYKYFIITEYNNNKFNYIIDLDKIFSTLVNLDINKIYILNKYVIEFILNKYYDEKLYLNINKSILNKLKKIYNNENFCSLIKDIFTMSLFNKTLLIFKNYNIFMKIFKNINLFNLFLENFKYYNFVFIVPDSENKNILKNFKNFIENNKLNYKIDYINSLISVKSNKQQKKIDINIKKFLNFCYYNNTEYCLTPDHVKNVLNYYPVLNSLYKKDQLTAIKSHINKYFSSNKRILEPLLKSVNKAFSIINENKPLGNFLLCGPSGSGKTELVKILTYSLFNSTKYLIKLNMSEYMEPHSISKLIGAPPGYIGYNSDNEFISKIKLNNKSVILFDEIEKAHKSINDLMLQILEESKLTLSNGGVLNFNNSFIFFTSNLGCDNALKTLNKSDYDKKILKSIKDFFRPEFVSRINNIIIFDPVSFKSCIEIIDSITKKIKLNSFNFSEFNINIKKEYINYSYNILYGLRPLYKLSESAFTKIENYSTKLFLTSNVKHVYLLNNINIQNFECNAKSYISNQLKFN